MQETWVQSLGWEHPLEKEMATHSSVLAWRIPGTGEPGELPSMGSHRVGHDWSDLAAAAVMLGFAIQQHESVICCCSVAKSCLTLCDTMDCSTPGFSVLHCLQEFAQIHVHWISHNFIYIYIPTLLRLPPIPLLKVITAGKQHSAGLYELDDRHISLCVCASLYDALQMLLFFLLLQIEGLWQPCIEQVYWHHFSNSIFSLCISLSHFGNSPDILSFFIIIIFIMMICNQWSLALQP